MHLIWTALIGFVAGLLARALMPGDDKAGIIVTTLLGIGGSFVAAWLGQAAGLFTPGQPVGFIASVVGAVVLLLAWRLIGKGASAGR